MTEASYHEAFAMLSKKRTLQQNKSFHKWLELLAAALNEAGYDQEILLRKLKVKAPVTKESLKVDIAHPIIMAMFNVDSTAKLSTKQIQELYLVMDSEISKVTGVTTPWPEERIPLEAYHG